jgi:hypothetical protein
MRLWRWMLVVAVIGLAMVPVVYLRRSYIYMKRAESCERRAEGASIRRKADDTFGIFGPEMFDANGQMTEKYEVIFEALRQLYEEMGRKYRHAATHPWETVEPDPPLLSRGVMP